METGNFHHSMEAEKLAEQLLLIPPEELEVFLDKNVIEGGMDWAAENMGKQRIRAIKNGLVSLITCVCRVAMRYGAEPEFAYTLSDYYIEHLETLNSEQKLAELMAKVMFHYNSLVRVSHRPNYSMNVNRAIDYISHHLYQPIKVREVAAHVGLEEHYFSTLFKKEMGKTPKEYIMDRKLETAVEMLQDPDNSVTYVALTMGFCDISHFEKCYRKKYGTCPGDMR